MRYRQTRAMRVHQSSLNNTTAAGLDKARQTEQIAPEQQKRGATPEPAQSDRVNLSDLSGRLLRLLAVEPPERTARIEQLTADVRAGRYEADTLAVSRSMIEEATVYEH